MQTQFSTKTWPYVVFGGFFLVISLICLTTDVRWAGLFLLAVAVVAIRCVVTNLSISVLDDSILMEARFGAIKDRIYYSEIENFTSKNYSGVKDMGYTIQTEYYSKIVTIKLKTGEEYVFTNSQFSDLTDLILAIRTKMETQPPSSPTV